MGRLCICDKFRRGPLSLLEGSPQLGERFGTGLRWCFKEDPSGTRLIVPLSPFQKYYPPLPAIL